jgi:hypothetical protein
MTAAHPLVRREIDVGEEFYALSFESAFPESRSRTDKVSVCENNPAAPSLPTRLTAAGRLDQINRTASLSVLNSSSFVGSTT